MELAEVANCIKWGCKCMEYAFLWSENYMEFMAEVPTQNVH